MPASNMKVVTTAIAADRLGWSTTFQTRLVSAAPLHGTTLDGDLFLIGAGDPSLGGAPGTAEAVLSSWATQLRTAGIFRITGRLIGVDDTLDDEGLGYGWSWDDLAEDYAAPISGLSFHENTVTLAFAPGHAAGDPVVITGTPAGHGLTLINHVVTSAAGTSPALDYRRLPGSTSVTVSGTVPAGRQDVTRVVSVDNPTAFTASVVKTALMERGVTVDGDAVDLDELSPTPEVPSGRVLATWTSAPLSDILTVLLKVSQNLYADTMLKLVGRVPAADGKVPAGSVATGRSVEQQTLTAWGVPATAYVIRDGSGLSRYNYLTPALLVNVLSHVYADEKLREPFLAALPHAGVDGTLARRMVNTPAQRNAKAKTGSFANTRSLSGYVTTADGEPVVFSIIANNFSVPSSEVDAIVDRAVARLANFRRR
jgi:serine-type D-Ala-D-Ala carboxypeptidase/endopeptidase (penicillin-binding protein 4)